MRAVKPARHVLVPIAISDKSQIFLEKPVVDAFRRDGEFVRDNHRDYVSLTTPSGIRLEAPSVHGKYVQLISHYVRESDFILKRMAADELDRTRRISRLLAERGLPVEEHALVQPAGKGEFSVLVPRRHYPFFCALNGKLAKHRLFERYLQAVGTLQALGYSHGHPHANNAIVAADGRVGLVDFSLAKRVRPNWNRASSILREFNEDYLVVLNILVRRLARKKGYGNDLNAGRFEKHLEPLVQPLPVTPAVKRQVVAGLKKMAYQIVRTLEAHGYFEER